MLAAFGASLEGLTRGMARDLKPVRVNLVHPGVVLTEMMDLIPKDLVPKDSFKAVLENAKAKTLAGSIGRPQDLAEAYLYLMKDQFISGTTITSDGGSLLT